MFGADAAIIDIQEQCRHKRAFHQSTLSGLSRAMGVFAFCSQHELRYTPFCHSSIMSDPITPSPLSYFDRHWFEFLHAMTLREIKARYKHAVLGFLWVILNPLLQMVIIGFVFQFFIPVEVDNYFLFLFSGLLPWMFFSLSLSKATPSIVHERSLIQKARFPRENIVLAIVLSNMFHFLISLVLLVMVLIGDKLALEHYSAIKMSWYVGRMIWLVPITIWMTALVIGMSLLTAALNVKFRDVNFIVQALLPLWFYGTPVVYSLDLLPQKLYPLFYLNPMTAIVESFHWVLLRFEPASLELMLISIIMTSLILYLGSFVFMREKKWFDDWL